MNPDEFTNRELRLDVGDGHELYIQDWGNPEAKLPIIYQHGGPGNGCDDRDKAKFDPQKQRLIFYDQRGAGQSTPTGSIEHNTTDKLVADIDKIADELKLDKFLLVGGSWGSTLSLAYGIARPDRVAGMVIDGVWTGSVQEADWLDKGGWKAFFPDVWEAYQATAPKEHRDDPTAYHYQQLKSGDAEAVKRSAYAYNSMELALLKLDDSYNPVPYDLYEPGGALIEMHYLSNGCFLKDNYILANAKKLSMPVYMIAGRYDMVCPPEAAYHIHKTLPDSKLIWTINGHLKQHEAKNVLALLLDQLTGVA